VLDPDVAPEVLEFARRDAERRTPEEMTPARMTALAQQGLRVVRVAVTPADPAEVQAVAAAGVAVEVLSAAPA
jgi:precorrin-2 dehydrogenase/sirohydrochlorin ferrochelatase